MRKQENRHWLPKMVLLVCGLTFLVNQGQAQPPGPHFQEVRAIADAIKKGDMAQANKLAAFYIKADEDAFFEASRTMALRKKGGFGVGKVPGAIQPDGIEAKILALAQNPLPPAQLQNEAEALIEMGYRVAAIGQVSLAVPLKKKTNKQNWTTFAKEMNDAALEFAQTVKAGNPAAVHKAAVKMSENCNKCHAIFR